MNQPMLTFSSSNLLLRGRYPSAQRPYFPEKDTPDPAHFSLLKSIAGLLAGKMKAAPLGLDEAKLR
jgi:hypothetical protein